MKERKKILINFLSPIAGGGITYIKNLLPELSQLDSNNKYFVFLRSSTAYLGSNLPDNFKIIQIGLPCKNLLLRFIYEQFILPIFIKKNRIDLLFSTADVTSFLSPCPVVLLIRNSNPYFQSKIKRTISKRIKFSLEKILSRFSTIKAREIIFVSSWFESTVSEQLKIPSHKALTIYHGVNVNDFKEVNEALIDENFKNKTKFLKYYILIVSDIYPHKNFEVVLKAYKKIPEDLKDQYKLVIAGRNLTPQYLDKLNEMVDDFKIENQVLYLGQVNYSNIPYLYKNSSLFVLPSLLESFGHTLVEAMAAGIPIIAASTTAIPEVMGTAGILFDPHNHEELAQKITKVLRDKKLRAELIKRANKRIKQFSWEKTTRETLEVFEKILNKKRNAECK